MSDCNYHASIWEEKMNATLICCISAIFMNFCYISDYTLFFMLTSSLELGFLVLNLQNDKKKLKQFWQDLFW